MTRYLERALAGAPVSAEEWNEHIVAFHSAFPNVTSQALSSFRDESGRSSYEVLGRCVRSRMPFAQTILDVGCGAGQLLLELLRQYGRPLALSGIDLSESDLVRAQAALPNAAFVCGDAATALPAGPFDVAVAHLSFLSIARLGAVLARIRESLEPHGLLAFMLEDLTHPNSIIPVMMTVMAALQKRFPRSSMSVPEREPFETPDGLREVLRRSGFDDVELQSIPLSAQLTAAEAADFAMMSYPFAMLQESLQSELRALALDSVRSRCDQNGRMMVRLPLTLVTTIPNRQWSEKR